jgi:hypothetical protein
MIIERVKDINKYIINLLVGEGDYKNADEVIGIDNKDNSTDQINHASKEQLRVSISELDEKFEIQKHELQSYQKVINTRILSCESMNSQLNTRITEKNENLCSPQTKVQNLPTNETLLKFGENLSTAMLAGIANMVNR